ncbi:hypothetical protein B7R21_08885 [Subtercola boreus]|uniref:SbsA Ig-like domain-containing protein n=1 Tax=Subtercola boreus TaxID=120213 RepID=A0A3E0VUB0_9MICO|nr:hypothetical protein [Subtercola boreus]RFA12953.1 hypothetical protein B7R21_08885 [Subtercola boreus]
MVTELPVADGSRVNDPLAVWEGGGIRVSGHALPEVLAVVPVSALALGGGLQPMAGRWVRHGGAALFTPRFPVVAGSGYAVVGRVDARQPWIELARLDRPSVRLERRTVVDRIDPGGSEVPANLLRFSVTFSDAMEEGSAAGHLSLLDAEGVELPGALLGMPPELWDRERRRLTVLLEPGRIKRGLQPNVQAGPPLEEGDTVTLAVDARLRDVSGAKLLAGVRRTYRVGAPVRSRVDPALWEVRWPASAGDALVVRFDRPLDRALVRRCLIVVDEGGHPVPGEADLDAAATSWTFRPASGVWAPALSAPALSAPALLASSLSVDTRLEDLAGNSVRRVFDRDLSLEGSDDSVAPGTLILRSDGSVRTSSPDV